MKTSKEKQMHLVIVGVVTLAIIGALWQFLIGAQNARLTKISNQITQSRDKAKQMEIAVKSAALVQDEYEDAAAQMAIIEKEMASGDAYAWMYNTIKDFKATQRVEIPQFSSVEVSDCQLLLKCPYKQVRMTVAGSSYFHDLGKFIADFENHFPHMRVQNLEVSPSGGRASTEVEREKLTFRMDIIALVKPSDTK